MAKNHRWKDCDHYDDRKDKDYQQSQKELDEKAMAKYRKALKETGKRSLALGTLESWEKTRVQSIIHKKPKKKPKKKR